MKNIKNCPTQSDVIDTIINLYTSIKKVNQYE